jgi:hypothetical protein
VTLSTINGTGAVAVRYVSGGSVANVSGSRVAEDQLRSASAANTNIVSGGYLRVTSSGLVQVDLDGGGGEWVTLSTINGSGAVAVRYLSGGTVANVSVSRVTEDQLRSASAANTNIALAGAVAAAGLVAAPAAAEIAAMGDDSLVIASASVASGTLDRTATSAGESTRPELTGEAKEALDEGVASFSGTDAGVASSSRSVAGGDAAIAPVTELSRGTDTPTASHPTTDAIVADAVAMPAAEMLQALQQDVGVEAASKSTGELGHVLAEALSGGGAKQIDALLDALAANDHAPTAAIVSHAAAAASWALGHGEIAAFAVSQFSTETVALHHDAPPTA